ncbi:integrin beta-1-like isoform X2 [Styela clava]
MTSSWILAACVALSLFTKLSADASVDAKCEDAQIQTCDACIQAHPKCAWCLEGEFNANIKRCRSIDKFNELGGCKDGKMENPQSKNTPTGNKDFSIPGKVSPKDNIVQLKPQKIHLELRKGESMKFNVTFRKVSDYPVDLYYVMDLSHSMTDDLQTLQSLGTSLANDIRSNVTQDIQLGFGTFVDKVMMPFASTVPAQLKNPCFKNQDGGQCAPPFGFKHQQKISDNLNAFRDAVTATQISGNIDSPEGGFDALMQIAVCTNEIGWRDESTHLVVFTTDASFHMALDGKLAAILEMNDLQCHLEKGANPYLPEDIVYSMSKEQDYPSIGQLRHVFNKYKIQPIFAVTEEVKPLYDGLRELIPNSHVDQLAKDSSNIIGIIKDAYNNLKGKLEMSWRDKPKNVDIKYRALCPSESDWKEMSLKCDNITIGSEVVYEFEMTANECPGEKEEIAPMTFTSSSLKESVTITFDFKCGCDCTGTPVADSPDCSTNGSLVCGLCQCDAEHEGAKCQCIREQKDVALVGKCKKDGPTDEICEGNGACECGNCTCNEGYSGTHCECSNKGCPKDENGKPCGGGEKGTCHSCNNNGRCECKNGWTRDDKLHTCTCHEKLCKDPARNDSLICSGHGSCECNRCVCEDEGKYWSEKYCQTCIHPKCKGPTPTCEGSQFVTCAVCVNEAQRQGNNVGTECEEECKDVEKKMVTKIPDCSNCEDENCRRVCLELDTNIAIPSDCKTPLPQSECEIVFQVVWFKNNNEFGIVVKEYNKDTDCRKPINPIYIVLPIVAGIVLLGLLALAAWKIYQTIRDKKEWENFEKEMKQSRWTKGQNPIFQKPFTKFQNPTYQGK